MKSVIGKLMSELDTPALVVDLTVMEDNIQRLQHASDEAGLQVRPHIKSHKTPEIAQMQMRAGAVGVTAAKIGEAEVMASAGIEDIFIANCLIGEAKMRRLVALARRTPRLSISVESLECARAASQAFEAAGMTLEVLLEVNSGADRTGVEPDEIVPFAGQVTELPALEIVGVMGYASNFSYTRRGHEELVKGAAEEGAFMAAVAADLEAAGHRMQRVSGGATPTAGRYKKGCGLTEIRCGTYLLNDMNQVDIGSCTVQQVALSILATVVAHPTGERAIIDAGTKGLSQQVGQTSDGYGWLSRPGGIPGAVVYKINDEHGFVDVSGAERDLEIGEKVRVIPPRTPTAVNLYDRICAVRDGTVQDVWCIAARGKNT